MTRLLEGGEDGTGKRFAVAVARFNERVCERLLRGAIDALRRAGVADRDIAVARVPGAFELPLACRWLAGSGRYDGIVALGAVIRGETSHYDYVCSEAARGILDASVETSVPIGFGVLTCENLEQALARSGGAAGNKGAEAAIAAVEMVGLRSAVATAPRADGAAPS
jgi:6,7-dimethyl-8-ribityllumazine synthase